jgi:RuvA, C-terminal domain
VTGTTVLGMLFGAALVAIGVLAAALADRIRGLRAARQADRAPRSARSAPAPIEVVEAELVPEPARGSGIRDMAKDVVAALVASGYKKPIATAAVDACTSAERATIEQWTRAALRRAARGGLS